MVALHAVPLSSGQVRTSDRLTNEVYQAAKAYIGAEQSWEALFRLACLCVDAPMEEKVTHCLLEMIATQQPDGCYRGVPDKDLAIARGALALYEYGNSREVLQSLLLYCSWVSANWPLVMESRDIRRRPGDLM